VAARLSTQLDSLINANKGTIAYRNNTNQDITDDINDQIEIKETRLENLEVSLRKQFANLEVLLSSLQAQMDYLGAQLNSLPSLYMASK